MQTSFNTYQGCLRRVITQKMELGGMTKQELSEAAGFHRDYLGHVLGGRRDATIAVLTAVAPFLCTTVHSLSAEAKAMADSDE